MDFLRMNVLNTSSQNRVLEESTREHESLSRIPTEILSHIFTFTLRPKDQEPAPWTVSTVCSRWRQTVISQPSFWVFIDLKFHRRKFTNSLRLETQLHRSGGLPLTVEFSVAGHAPTSEDLEMLQIIARHAGRWEALQMSGPKALFSHLRACLHDRLALLRRLYIELEYGRNDDQDDGWVVDDADGVPSLDIFIDTPRLQYVSANKASWLFPLSMALPWSQLLRYGGSNRWDGHLHSLRSATNLVDCSLEIPLQEHETPTFPQVSIVLSHLRRLSISQSSFLDCLETPVLLELYCRYAPATLPFLRRQRKLQKLVIHAPRPVYGVDGSLSRGDTSDLTRMLEAATTITDLAVMFIPPAAFVRDLSDSSLSMAPALERFTTYRIVGEDSAEVQNDLLHAVETRWRHGHGGLRCVKMPGPWAPGILDRIELLQSQGMEFVVAPGVIEIIGETVPPEMRITSG